jgi:hypothetical protein
MSTDRQLDEQISGWLEAEAPRQLPDLVLRATFQRTRKTRQQGRWRALLGRIHMPRPVLALASAAVVVAVAAAALSLNNANQPGVGGQPSPPPSQTPTETPTAPPSATPVPSESPGAGGVPEGPFAVAGGLPITVTIPAGGWTYNSDLPAFGKGEEVANLPEAAILLWSFPAGTEFYVYGDPCRLESTRPDSPVITSDEIATALAAQASRDASAPVDVVVGGHAGKSIILHVPDDAAPDACEGGEFASYGIPGDDPTRFHQGPGQIDEFWILDVDGAIVIFDAMYRPDTPPDLVEEMRSIAESATFDTP